MPMLSRCDQKLSKKGFWHPLNSYFPQMTLRWFGDGNIHQLQRSPHARRKDSPVHAHTDCLSCITGDAPWTEGRLEMHIATWCEELTHWEKPWCWERLKAGREGGDRGWDGQMASPIQWTWVWADSGRWWRTGKPGVLQSMGSQRVRHDLVTEQQKRKILADFRDVKFEKEQCSFCSLSKTG